MFNYYIGLTQNIEYATEVKHVYSFTPHFYYISWRVNGYTFHGRDFQMTRIQTTSTHICTFKLLE